MAQQQFEISTVFNRSKKIGIRKGGQGMVQIGTSNPLLADKISAALYQFENQVRNPQKLSNDTYIIRLTQDQYKKFIENINSGKWNVKLETKEGKSLLCFNVSFEELTSEFNYTGISLLPLSQQKASLNTNMASMAISNNPSPLFSNNVSNTSSTIPELKIKKGNRGAVQFVCNDQNFLKAIAEHLSGGLEEKLGYDNTCKNYIFGIDAASYKYLENGSITFSYKNNEYSFSLNTYETLTNEFNSVNISSRSSNSSVHSGNVNSSHQVDTVQPIEPPDEFTCPISMEIMKDPVILNRTKQVYERASIEKWFLKNNTCPSTGVELKEIEKNLTPYKELQKKIEQWKKDPTAYTISTTMPTSNNSLTLNSSNSDNSAIFSMSTNNAPLAQGQHSNTSLSEQLHRSTSPTFFHRSIRTVSSSMNANNGSQTNNYQASSVIIPVNPPVTQEQQNNNGVSEQRHQSDSTRGLNKKN